MKEVLKLGQAGGGESHLPRLSRRRLGDLPPSVKRPQYDLAGVAPGVLSMGPGCFFKTHLCWYLDQVLATDPAWGVVACSIRANPVTRLLRQQEGLFVHLEEEREESRASVVGPICSTLGKGDPWLVVEQIADPRIRLLTLIATPSGYHATDDGNLNLKDKDVIHDLGVPAVPDTEDGNAIPRTALWYLWRGLVERKRKGGGHLSVLSLDNIQDNSLLLQRVLLQYGENCKGYLDHAAWVEDHVDFLPTVVDCITPDTPPESYAKAARLIGQSSDIVAVSERFRQFVIRRGRFTLPPWEGVGVQLVPDHKPYWDWKFWGLNAAHQVAALVAQALGMGAKHVHDAMDDQRVNLLVKRFHGELAPCLPGTKPDIFAYLSKVRQRFRDPALNHLLARITKGTTKKVSDRVLAAAEYAEAASGKMPSSAVFVFATWLLFNSRGRDYRSGGYPGAEPEDTRLGLAQAMLADWDDSRRSLLPAILRDHIAGPLEDRRFSRLAQSPGFIQDLSSALEAISRDGIEAALTDLLRRPLAVAA